jgi:hypothetical protein
MLTEFRAKILTPKLRFKGGYMCFLHYVLKIIKIRSHRYLQRLLPLAMTRLNIY